MRRREPRERVGVGRHDLYVLPPSRAHQEFGGADVDLQRRLAAVDDPRGGDAHVGRQPVAAGPQPAFDGALLDATDIELRIEADHDTLPLRDLRGGHAGRREGDLARWQDADVGGDGFTAADAQADQQRAAVESQRVRTGLHLFDAEMAGGVHGDQRPTPPVVEPQRRAADRPALLVQQAPEDRAAAAELDARAAP